MPARKGQVTPALALSPRLVGRRAAKEHPIRAERCAGMRKDQRLSCGVNSPCATRLVQRGHYIGIAQTLTLGICSARPPENGYQQIGER